MNALAKQLAQSIPVKLNTKVSSIRDGRDGPLEVELENGEWITANHCIVTAPAPQAYSWFTGFAPTEVSAISFAPCIVGMFTFDGSSSIPSPGHMDEGLPDGVERVVDHNKKGISSTVTVSVYMTGDWSKQYDRAWRRRAF